MASNRRGGGRNFSDAIFEPLSGGLYEKCLMEVSGGVKQRTVRTGIIYEVISGDDDQDIVSLLDPETLKIFRIRRRR